MTMKFYYLVFAALLVACSDSGSDDSVMSDGSVSEDPALNTGAQDVIAIGQVEPEVTAQDMERLEASILSSTRSLSMQQAAQSEQANINELENLSDTDRQALSDKSAENTAKAAEEKAESQAVSAALRSVE